MFLKRLLIFSHSEIELPRATMRCTWGNMSEVSITIILADDQSSSSTADDESLGCTLITLCVSLSDVPLEVFSSYFVVIPGRKINECLNYFERMNLSEWIRND